MSLEQNLCEVKERLAAAARRAGRAPGDITLLAVSKTHPPELIAAAASLGQVDFGENYMQDALNKQDLLADMPQCRAVRWHFIGHLQSNKARQAAGRFSLIHTLDSLKLAQGLHNKLQQTAEQQNADPLPLKNLTQEVLIQVNIGQEAQKSGVAEQELEPLAEGLMGLSRIRLKGLMCIPPFNLEPGQTRACFARLRQLLEILNKNFGQNRFNILSMGMSQDFEIAIEEGATLVRVGTDIFGAR